MKIGFITDSIRDDATGIGVYTKGIIRAFQKYYPNNEYYYIDYQKTKFNESKMLLIKNPLSINKMSLWYNYLPLILKKEDLDYVFNFMGMPHLIPFKQKEIFVVHDFSHLRYPQFHPFKGAVLFKLLFSKNLRTAFKILANSEETRFELITKYKVDKDKVLTIFIPIFSNKKKRPKFLTNKPFILNLNTIQPRKNIINLIKAYEYLKDLKQIPHLLMIVGKLGWKYKEILKVINNSKYNKEIKYVGYLNDKQKNYLFNRASVFVYPSFYEGLGIPILESLYNQCPVVCAATPTAREYAKGAILTIDPNNIKEMALTIYKAITRQDIRKRLINGGYIKMRNLAEETKIKRQVDNLISFIDE